jgi:soluble lytic murein transglycosylase-like protein
MMFLKVRDAFILVILAIIAALLWRIDTSMSRFEKKLEIAEGTVSFQMYESIEHWSDSFEIPKHIAYNIAYKETRYRGPFDFKYEHRLESSAGAVGPMQIITKWAQKYSRRRVSERELKTNVDLNVKISMQMLRKWHSIYGDWTKACGAYNSGQPIKNEYAIYCVNNKDYKNKWVNLN